MPESGIACEVLKQDFSGGFVLIPDKAQPEQEAAECVFVVVRFRWLAEHTLHAPCHPAQPLNEFRISRRFVRTGRKREPREADRILCHRKADFISLERPPHQPAFVFHQLCKVLQCIRREQLFWDADGQPVLRLFRFASEVFFFQMFQKAADRFPVHAVRDAERPVLFQCAVTNLISQARCFLVAWDCV